MGVVYSSYFLFEGERSFLGFYVKNISFDNCIFKNFRVFVLVSLLLGCWLV